MAFAAKRVLGRSHPLFRHREVRAGVFVIEEKYFESWNKANIFFVKGRDKDLLIDTGQLYSRY